MFLGSRAIIWAGRLTGQSRVDLLSAPALLEPAHGIALMAPLDSRWSARGSCWHHSVTMTSLERLHRVRTLIADCKMQGGPHVTVEDVCRYLARHLDISEVEAAALINRAALLEISKASNQC